MAVTVRGLNVERIKSIPVDFNLEGKAEGEVLEHAEVYADPDTQDHSSGNVASGQLQIKCIVGKGVESVMWNEKSVESGL